MKKLDDQERLIIRELIKNPRMSDNAIARATGVPVMTVNRKRRKLEEENLIKYFASIEKGVNGLGIFEAHQMYVIQLQAGITAKDYYAAIEKDGHIRMHSTRFVSLTYLGEKDGHLTLVLLLDAPSQKKLSDEFNGKIVPYIKRKLGDNSIVSIDTIPIIERIRVHHNYIPKMNMKNGHISPDWPDQSIFIDDVSEKKDQSDLSKHL